MQIHGGDITGRSGDSGDTAALWMENPADKVSSSQERHCPLCGQCFGGSEDVVNCPNDGALLVSDASDVLIGVIVDDKYRIEAHIGSGGWRRVYRAHHLLLNQPVAIKFLSEARGADMRALGRLRQEAQAASLLHHPNIASVREFGVLNGESPYIVMQFVEGKPLSEILQSETSIACDRALELCIQLSDALSYAHRNGVVHRDIKPGNVLVELAGERGNAKIVDFGIATFLDDEETTSRLTRTGEVFGTPAYMSPEQCQGHRLDARQGHDPSTAR